MPPGLPIPQKTEDGQQQVLQDVAKSLAAMAQYLQSGLTMDQDSEFEYKDSDGTVQGPFLGSQLSEWNEAVRRLLFIPPLLLLTLVVLLSSSNQPTNQSTLLFVILCFLSFFFLLSRRQRQLAHLHLCGAFLTFFYYFYKQGYLEKKLHVRKKSIVPDMGEGAFIELQKLYDLDSPDQAFRGNPKQRAKEAVNFLDSLLKKLVSGDNVDGAEMAAVDTILIPASVPEWTEMLDADSGAPYWYNTISGASQWENPA